MSSTESPVDKISVDPEFKPSGDSAEGTAGNLETAPQLVTSDDIRKYGACKVHRAWKLLCCKKDLVCRKEGEWFWRDRKPSLR